MLQALLPSLHQLIVQFSYLGIFSIAVVSSSTIFIPFPIYTIIFFSTGLGLNPLATGIIAGLGSALGELTGYFIGLGGTTLALEKKKSRWVKPIMKYFKRYGFVTISITAFLPFPFDIVGILSGMGKYNIKKFLIATSIGKISKSLLITYAGALLIPYVSQWVF